MLNSEDLGYCGPASEGRLEYLAISFSPLNAPLRSRWRNNGLSADFLGDYVTTFLPGGGVAGQADGHQSEVRHAVTYIANEFLENAMKYHARDVDIPIAIRLELTSDEITVHASNAISPDQASRYKSFINCIEAHDAGDLLAQQLEAGSVNPESSDSCLGLLTMISDYGVRLGWRFDVDATGSGAITVTTSALLPLIELSRVSA